MEGKKRSRLLSVLLVMAMIATMMFADCGVVSASTERGKVKSIKYIYPSSLTYEENTNGQWSLDKNGEFYYRYTMTYDAEPKVFTVEYENGEEVTYSEAYGKGDAYWSEHSYRGSDGGIVTLYNCVRSNQNEKHFTVGNDNYFTFNFGGAEKKIPVEIKNVDGGESIYSIEYEPKDSITFDYAQSLVVYNGEQNIEQLYWSDSHSVFRGGDKLTKKDKYTEEERIYIYDETENQFISEDGEKISLDEMAVVSDQDLAGHDWSSEKDDCYLIVSWGYSPTKVPITIKENDVTSISIYVGEDSELREVTCEEELYDEYGNWNGLIDGITVHKTDGTAENIIYKRVNWIEDKEVENGGYYEKEGFFDENENEVELSIRHQKMKESGQWYVYYHGVSCEIPTSHSNVNWTLKEKPTCSKKGIYEKTCVCGEVLETKEVPIDPAAHSFTAYTYNNDAQIGVDGTETAVCNNGCGAKDTRTKKGTALGNSGSSGGGGFLPPPTTPAVQEPTISTGEGYTTELSEDGKTVNITVKDGYEIEEVLVNGISKGKVTSLSDLKTGDKVEVKVVKKEVTPTIEEVKAELAKVTTENFKANSAQVKMKNGKKAIKITWKNASGAKFDGIEIFRSTKKNSGYGKKPIFTSKSGKFYNTSIKKGKRYYYKVRGYIELDGVKYYSAWSTKAYRTVK
ncbi:hypothetical protein ACDL92_00990 [Ihubacter sp. mB4P-1]|uniref:hypothetical protein n=1 Tax=Ihubacter sp. mB4P-1 TaxID=3242370 RepID=UPI003C7C2B72